MNKILTNKIFNDTILNIHLNITLNIKGESMNRNKIVSAVKRQEEEKVGFSLKLPISVKEELQKISEKESISMNSLIVATLQSMIDDECGQQLAIAKTLLSSYKSKIVQELEQYEYEGLDQDSYEYYNKIAFDKRQIDELLKDK
jgi:hypothetical protein